MEKIRDENLFDIHISQEGLMNLNGGVRIIGLLFRFAIGCSVLFSLNIVVLQLFYMKKQVTHTGSIIAILQTIAYPILGLLDMVIFLWQLYTFKQFGTQCKKAISESDEVLLSQSFKFFYRYTRIALLQIFVVFIMYCISLYFAITLIAAPL
jgi:hypothetical protein